MIKIKQKDDCAHGNLFLVDGNMPQTPPIGARSATQAQSKVIEITPIAMNYDWGRTGAESEVSRDPKAFIMVFWEYLSPTYPFIIARLIRTTYIAPLLPTGSTAL